VHQYSEIHDLVSFPPSLSESCLFVNNFSFSLQSDPFQYDLKKDLACTGDKSSCSVICTLCLRSPFLGSGTAVISPCTFAVRQHLGPQLSSFEPVTAEEVRKLLSSMLSKSSPLDVLPCSLLKSLHAHVFTPAIARPVTADWKVSCPIQESAGASTAEEGRARQFTASELQADLQPADRVQGPGETRVGTPAVPPAQICQLQPVPVCIQKDIPQRLHYWRSWTESSRRPTTSR